mmetsp:Transcript_87072/g.227320  ORF Transcript_87072/g.227320 Transcript_87072/m.227320 type:complete len:87 (+) Transcript_87072:20-280(+)
MHRERDCSTWGDRGARKQEMEAAFASDPLNNRGLGSMLGLESRHGTPLVLTLPEAGVTIRHQEFSKPRGSPLQRGPPCPADASART